MIIILEMMKFLLRTPSLSDDLYNVPIQLTAAAVS